MPTIMVLINRVPLMKAVEGDTVVAQDLGVEVEVEEEEEAVVVVVVPVAAAAALMLKGIRASRSWSAM